MHICILNVITNYLLNKIININVSHYNARNVFRFMFRFQIHFPECIVHNCVFFSINTICGANYHYPLPNILTGLEPK